MLLVKIINHNRKTCQCCTPRCRNYSGKSRVWSMGKNVMQKSKHANKIKSFVASGCIAVSGKGYTSLTAKLLLLALGGCVF